MLPLIIDQLPKPSTIAIGRGQKDRPIIDSWPGSPIENTARLSNVGLADAFTWARQYHELSDGQRARWNIADLLRDDGEVCVFDDFCNGLDRVTARAVAWTLQKNARKYGKTIICLTPHEDLDQSLAPDVHIRTNWAATPEITYRSEFPGTSDVLQELRYERGTIADWHALAPLHYAAGDPATTHSYHVLRHPNSRHPAAVCVLSYPDLHSAARNLATEDAYRIGGSRQQAMRLNREVLKLSRIVVAPEFRTLGLTGVLIEKIVPQVNCRYLECTTAMGRYSPFLTKLGFREVPQTAHPTEAALAEFVEVNQIDERTLIDPELFAGQVEKLSVRNSRRLRKIVWQYYHHFVLHRRTRKPVPKAIPGPTDSRWSEAWEIAAKRALERPAYFILGPLTGGFSSDRSTMSPSEMSKEPQPICTTSSNPSMFPSSIQTVTPSTSTPNDRQLPVSDRVDHEDV